MLISILLGFLIGYVLAMPPGPVAVSAVNLSFDQKSRKPFLLYAAGSALLDVFYGLIAAFAATAFISIFANFSNSYPYVMFVFQVIVILVFVIVGIRTVRRKKDNKGEKTNEIFKKVDKFTEKRPFFLGALVSGTNLANPAFLSLLLYIILQLRNFNIIPNTIADNFLFAISFGLGNFFWLFTLSNIISRKKHLLTASFIGKIKRFGGVIYLLFAGALAYKVSLITNCMQILRFIKF